MSPRASSAALRAAGATLLADVGVAIFRTGFDRWVDNLDGDDLAARLREAGAELADAVVPTNRAPLSM